MITASDERTDRLARLRAVAYRIRRHALDMAEVQGQGYIGQALGVADILAVLYADQMRFRPEDPDRPDRDRFLLSTEHYAIALYMPRWLRPASSAKS
jgi:transketolase